MTLHLVTEGSLSRHERDVLLHWLASNFVDNLQLSIAVAFADKEEANTWLSDVINQSFRWGGEPSTKAATSLWGLAYRDNAEEAERREELIKKLLTPLIRQRVMNDLS